MLALTTVGQQLAEYGAQLSWDRLPTAVRDRSRDRLLDVLSTAAAGRSQPVTQVALDSVDQPLSAADRAFVQAVAAHALLWDDSNPALADHPGVVIVPAVLAVAEHRDVTMSELLTAVVCGYETQFALGRLSARPMIGRGLRTTSALGVVGAAAAVARLLALDTESTRAALDVAANLAGGLLQGFDETTMEPFLHAGLAARSGIHAARLGQAGAVTSRYTFEGPTGYLNALAAPTVAPLEIGATWAILQIASKPFPISGAKIGATAAALAARSRGIDPGAIVNVVVQAPTTSLAYPGSDNSGPFERAAQAQNSFQFCVAAALAGRSLTSLATFSASDDLITNLIPKIELIASTTGRTDLWIELTDGRTEHVEAPPAADLRTPSVAGMAEKLAGFLPASAARLVSLVGGDPAAPVGELFTLLRGEGVWT